MFACAEPAIGYVRTFRGNAKAASYPACAKHYLIALAYQEIGQDLVRDVVEKLLPIKRSNIPRLKVGWRP